MFLFAKAITSRHSNNKVDSRIKIDSTVAHMRSEYDTVFEVRYRGVRTVESPLIIKIKEICRRIAFITRTSARDCLWKYDYYIVDNRNR